jgi:hypothetical protein
MKTFLPLALILLSTNLFAGEFEKELDDFNTITVAGNFEVYLEKGDKPGAKVVNTDPELLDEQIQFVQKGADLRITTKGNSVRKLSLKIYLTYTSMVEVNCNKGGWLETKNPLEGEKVTLNVSTDGVIHAQLSCKNVEASVLTGGTIRLSGSADIAQYKVSAGGFISGKEVKAKTVAAKISSGGDISCYASEKMDLKTSIGTIKYIFEGDKSNFTEKATLGGEIKKFGGK